MEKNPNFVEILIAFLNTLFKKKQPQQNEREEEKIEEKNNNKEEEEEEEEKKKKKEYYENFTGISKISEETPSIKKAKEFTESILKNKPSGDPSKQDTLHHVIFHAFGGEENEMVFFDSTEKKDYENLKDYSSKLGETSSDAPKPFVLKLNDLTGFGDKPDHKLTEQEEKKHINELNKSIHSNKKHPILDDVRKRLARVHNVSPEDVIIKHVYSGTANFVYTINHLEPSKIQEVQNTTDKLKEQFKNFLDLKVHPLLYRPTFDISMFDVAGNKTFSSGSEFDVGPAGNTEKYRQPTGWTRYGFKVLGKYDNDTWLHPFQHPNNWYRAYHGTGNAQPVDFGNQKDSFQNTSVDAIASIFKDKFRTARTTRYESGVYCSPNPDFPPSGYVKTITLNTVKGSKKFQCMLQVAVNPNTVHKHDDIWVVPDPSNIRPYGILIREVP